MMNVLALDPGTTTGYALFKGEDGELFGSGVMGKDTVIPWIDAVKPGLIIYEAYRNRPYVKQGGSDMPASQVIGKIKEWCRANNVHYVEQDPSVLPIALKWAGIKQPKGHLSDENSAIAHGVYYLQKHGIRKSRLLRG